MHFNFILNLLTPSQQNNFRGISHDITDRFKEHFPYVLPKNVKLTVNLGEEGWNNYFHLTALNDSRANAVIYFIQLPSYCGGLFLYSMSYNNKLMALPLLHAVMNYFKAEKYTDLTYVTNPAQDLWTEWLKAVGFTKSFEAVSSRTRNLIKHWNTSSVKFLEAQKYTEDFWGKEVVDLLSMKEKDF